MCGFSDGGSGAYHLAMLEPTDYALFFPWSGKISVGTIVGGIQVYPANLTARPLFPVNGGKDGLYPAEKLLPMMKFLMEYVGPELSYIAYDTAGHNPGYLSKELPLFTARVKAMPRRPLRSRLTWECSDPEFGRLDWINITAIDTSSEGDDWRQDLNFPQVDDRIMIGFMSDREYEGEGVRIASVVDDTTSIAHQMGLMDGDIVVALDEIPVKNIGDLGAAKRTKERGDQVTITVIRGDDNLTLSGVFPPPREYDAFPHKTPSASIEAYCIGNHFYVTTYRVKDFSLYIHPEMVRLDQPVVVTVDGKILFDALIKPDSRLLLDEFLKDRDRKLLWAGRIDVKL